MDLKRRMPLLRWSVWRMVIGVRNITITGQIGDGREAAAVDYVLRNSRAGDIDDVLATIDKYAYEKSILMNVGDEKGKLLDAAVRRADPKLALELGTYCGYGALRIARAAPNAKVYSVELAEANATNARQIWAHAGVAEHVTCVVGTIGDDGLTLDTLANEHGFTTGAIDFMFLDHDKNAYLNDLLSIVGRGWLHPGSIVVADNVRLPGAPKYRAYMRQQQGKLWNTVEHKTHAEYQTLSDLVLESDYAARSRGRKGNVVVRAASARAHCARVGARPHFAQRVHGDQRVDLRRRHRGMTQQLLHDPDVGAALEQMGGKRMPQHVRRHTRGDAGALGGVLQNLPCALPRQPAAARIEEDGRCAAAPARQLRTSPHQIGVQRLHRGPSHRHQPLLAALPAQQRRPGLGVDVVDVEADASEIRDPVEYSSSSSARLRSVSGPSAGLSPPAPSSSASTSSIVRLLGSRRPGVGGRTARATSSSARPSAAANRCQPRTAISARAADTADSAALPDRIPAAQRRQEFADVVLTDLGQIVDSTVRQVLGIAAQVAA